MSTINNNEQTAKLGRRRRKIAIAGASLAFGTVGLGVLGGGVAFAAAPHRAPAAVVIHESSTVDRSAADPTESPSVAQRERTSSPDPRASKKVSNDRPSPDKASVSPDNALLDS